MMVSIHVRWFTGLVFLIMLIPSPAFETVSLEQSWIRINQIGYLTKDLKVAVWCSMVPHSFSEFQLVDAKSGKIVFTRANIQFFGSYGPFSHSARLDFSNFQKPGNYYIRAGSTRSPEFEIGDNVYKGTADFALRYMRQQRSGFNPYLNDSCHTRDGYTLYGEKAGIPDSTYIDVVGGWHDASDYLQYSTTSANATFHLLMAYRDFPNVFKDSFQSNGLPGKNEMADVLDEAKWGLDWLLKMHPKENWLFNQIADDRDHISMRMPAQDSQYGRGYQRPVYFIDGEPQQQGKFLNHTTGTSSTAAKFSSTFNLGTMIFRELNPSYSLQLAQKANSAYSFALIRPGVTQTVSVRSPYIYAEDNWVDDMELALAMKARISSDREKESFIKQGWDFATQEPITPWIFRDTANHYQYYPFVNLGHYELAKQSEGALKDSLVRYYQKWIEMVWGRARQNAFYRGVPFVWCSNNLTVAFALQCYWYRQLSGDDRYRQLEQANIDWLFGCNPWGISMVYGLPAHGDTPVDPHSAFTHLKGFPIDGGLVDGPVYTSIFRNLIGISLMNPDEYSAFQSDLVVYHDDYGDYSTNEPTMDGTASLVYLLASKEITSVSVRSKKK